MLSCCGMVQLGSAWSQHLLAFKITGRLLIGPNIFVNLLQKLHVATQKSFFRSPAYVLALIVKALPEM